ncbi:MAG: GNAT family N-acetyltransferase [Nocardioidaceae bacterium]
MRCGRVDPADLDLQTADEMADVNRAELALEMPTAVPMTGEGLMLQARHGFDDSPVDRLWLVRDDKGRLAGHGSLEVSQWDNPQLAMVFCSVHPRSRGAGVGSLLLDAQVSAARELGRSSLLTFAPEDGYPTRFLTAHSFTTAQHTAQRRLHPQELDYSRIERLADDAARHADGYELVRLEGPAPDDMLPGLTSLFEAINDAPRDDLSTEPDTFPVERVRRYDTAMDKRRQHVYRLLARERRTGEWAGHTILCVDETRPGYAVQEDTSVLHTHRGHRLGMWLKASMLLWMHRLRPELAAIDTWNATTNTHMIAVNEALGCEVSALGVALQRTL